MSVKRVRIVGLIVGAVVVGLLANSRPITEDQPVVDYYGRTITWAQVEDLHRSGMALYSVTGGGRSVAFDTDAEAQAFTDALVARQKAQRLPNQLTSESPTATTTR